MANRMNSIIKTADAGNISQAAQCVKEGKVVIFPSETVYGLACDACNSDAIRLIYNIKSRLESVPLQIMVDSMEDAEKIGFFDDNALKIAKKFWPGPLTIVVRRREGAKISYLATAGLQTIGIRIPDNPIALKLIRQTARPVAATSANISKTTSPVSVDGISQNILEKVAMVLDGGRAKIGVSSTVIDATGAAIKILREGSVTKEDINILIEE